MRSCRHWSIVRWARRAAGLTARPGAGGQESFALTVLWGCEDGQMFCGGETVREACT
jgi:hypothetical protein